jgi:hypothetical protein
MQHVYCAMIAFGVAACAAPAPGAPATPPGGNMLTNASFEIAGPLGPFVISTGYRGVGHSAAADWGVFHNTKGTTQTELEPADLPGSGDLMLRVETDGAANGVSQVFGPFNTGPACATVSAWVYVLEGQVYIGGGNGGNTGPNVYSESTNTWEYLEATNDVCPVNTYIIYAASQGGAHWFVDLASVEVLPCAGPPGDFNLDGFVDASDLAELLASWGPCPGCPADINDDNVVGAADLGFLLSNWGCSPPA